MRIHRLYTDQPLEVGRETDLDAAAASYLGRVLRVQIGQSVVLFNGDGHDYVADISAISRSEARAHIRSRLPGLAESPLDCELVQAVCRGERMDLALQKATELGVSAIQPLLTERVEVRLPKDRLKRRLKHWRGVVASACEQSGRAVVPIIATPISLEVWLGRFALSGRQGLVMHPSEGRPLASVDLSDCIALVVGPEGGFARSELDRMALQRIEAVTLGPRILRTETAGPAALAVLQCLVGDFRP